MLQADLAVSCGKLRSEQLRALRTLIRINRQIILKHSTLNHIELTDLLEEFTTAVEYLRGLERVLSNYRSRGIDDSNSPQADAVRLRWIRLTRSIPRAQECLDTFHKSMPLSVPSFSMSNDGEIERNL